MGLLATSKTKDRGLLRGFFVFTLALSISLVGCDRKKAQPDAADASKADSNRKAAADASLDDAGTPDRGAATDGEEPAPQVEPQWVDQPQTLDALKSEIAGRDIGRLSGEIFGEDRVVRHVNRAQCGAGTVLQFVYDDGGELQVTPGMAVRYFGLATGKPVTYSEGDFEITVDFDTDTEDQLTGRLRITYQEEGEEKVYVDARVDGKPEEMLFEPDVTGKGRMPLFEQCFPNGYFRAVEEDGTEHLGLLHVTDVKGRGAPLARVLLGEGTGLRVFLLPPKPNRSFETEEPLKLSQSRNPGTTPAAVLIEAFRVPELIEPASAIGGNLGQENTVQVQQGTAAFSYEHSRTKPHLNMTLRDVKFPMLIDGPLHGKTFEVIEIDAFPTPPGKVSMTLGPRPDWWTKDGD